MAGRSRGRSRANRRRIFVGLAVALAAAQGLAHYGTFSGSRGAWEPPLFQALAAQFRGGVTPDGTAGAVGGDACTGPSDNGEELVSGLRRLAALSGAFLAAQHLVSPLLEPAGGPRGSEPGGPGIGDSPQGDIPPPARGDGGPGHGLRFGSSGSPFLAAKASADRAARSPAAAPRGSEERRRGSSGNGSPPGTVPALLQIAGTGDTSGQDTPAGDTGNGGGTGGNDGTGPQASADPGNEGNGTPFDERQMLVKRSEGPGADSLGRMLDLGTVLDGTDPNGLFPCAGCAGPAPGAHMVEPALGAAAHLLGDWLNDPENLNANWGPAPQEIPGTWTPNHELALVYSFDIAVALWTEVEIRIETDSAFYAWLDGEFLFGFVGGGETEGVGGFDIAFALEDLVGGTHFLQILLENHGDTPSFAFELRGVPVPVAAQAEVPEPKMLALLIAATLLLGRTRRRAGSTSTAPEKCPTG